MTLLEELKLMGDDVDAVEAGLCRRVCRRGSSGRHEGAGKSGAGKVFFQVERSLRLLSRRCLVQFLGKLAPWSGSTIRGFSAV